MVSCGVLFQDVQRGRLPVADHPRLVRVVTVLASNFVGDGLRAAADPDR